MWFIDVYGIYIYRVIAQCNKLNKVYKPHYMFSVFLDGYSNIVYLNYSYS